MPKKKARRAVGRPRGKADKDKTLSFGSHLRHARVAHGLRLKELADAADCSESILSKIENNKVNPSIKLLQRVCVALKMTVADLLVWVEKGDDVVMRAADRTKVRFSENALPGIIMQRLGPFGRRVGGYINVIESGGWTGILKHEGEELGYLLAGNVELVVGDRTFKIAAGDSFCFQSDIPHSYRNTADNEAQIIIINSPPSF
jgi:transcriptional regulator with XRE-family HTH domain